MSAGIEKDHGNPGVLFADACGSVRLYERLGNDLALELISQHLGFLSDVIGEFSGQVVKTIGDELMCVFPDSEHTARAGVQMFKRLRSWSQNQQNPICFKVGMHCGEVIHKGGDIFGDTVNLAARMVSLANENQLILTSMMLDRLPVDLQSECRLVGPIYVKGKKEAVAVHELVWDISDAASATVVGPSKAFPLATHHKLMLQLGEQVCTVDEQHPTASIGRSADSDLMAPGSLVSRHHLMVEQRGDNFIVTDKSTNATFVGSVLDSSGQRLHRDQLMLIGRGWLSLGQSNPEEDQKIHYEIV